MKILQINTLFPQGSTGRIAKDLLEQCEQNNIECMCACRYLESNEKSAIPISTWLDCHIHNRLASITHLQGLYSKSRTRRFLRAVKKYDPDIIHLHNIHGSYINLPMLFDFLAKGRAKVVWTIHDCWPFTGFCPYYSFFGCNKWKVLCHDCAFSKKIPGIPDTTAFMFQKKKSLFNKVANMTLVANSKWTKEQLKVSFLKNKDIRLIYNGVDLSVFKPTEGTEVSRKYNLLPTKRTILGVAFGWDEKKGIDIFCELANQLDSDLYQIVLVGVDEATQKTLPSSIVCIKRTQNQSELAALYSFADVFVNPTRGDSLGMTNIEANACGTPVITFPTGGCPECISSTSGLVCQEFTSSSIIAAINTLFENPFNFSYENCILNAARFNKTEKYKEYIDLYKSLCPGK